MTERIVSEINDLFAQCGFDDTVWMPQTYSPNTTLAEAILQLPEIVEALEAKKKLEAIQAELGELMMLTEVGSQARFWCCGLWFKFFGGTDERV